MNGFSGARYPATAMRRFYPAIYGRNLTFQPSQYGTFGADDTEKKTFLQSAGSFLSEAAQSEGFKETAGAITGTLFNRALQSADQERLDREAQRQAMLAESQARQEESRARTVALQAALEGGKPTAAIWIGGGIALLLLTGVGIYFATRTPKTGSEEAV